MGSGCRIAVASKAFVDILKEGFFSGEEKVRVQERHPTNSDSTEHGEQ